MARERRSPAARQPSVIAVVATVVAMALCGAAFRLLDGRDGALPLVVSIGAVVVVTAGLVAILERVVGPATDLDKPLRDSSDQPGMHRSR